MRNAIIYPAGKLSLPNKKLKRAKRSIEEALDSVLRAKRDADDDARRKLRNAEDELERALKDIKQAIREIE
jgi:hypothetical protein